jgi:hypothetical protein
MLLNAFAVVGDIYSIPISAMPFVGWGAGAALNVGTSGPATVYSVGECAGYW